MKTILLVCLNLAIFNSYHAEVSAREQFTNVFQSDVETNEIVFDRFIAHRKQNGIQLSWNCSGTSSVSYFVIEKSYDGFYFNVVDHISGSAKGATNYFDANVYPGFIHYRIMAVLTDGSVIESPVQVVRLVSKR